MYFFDCKNNSRENVPLNVIYSYFKQLKGMQSAKLSK